MKQKNYLIFGMSILLILISGCAPTIKTVGEAHVNGWIYIIETNQGIKPFLVTESNLVWDSSKIKEKTGIDASIKQTIVPKEIIDFAEKELNKCSQKYIIEEWVPVYDGWLGISSNYISNNETKGILSKGILLQTNIPSQIFLTANCICEPKNQKETVPSKDKQIVPPREGRTERTWSCATDSLLESRKTSKPIIEEYLKANNIDGKILFDYSVSYPLIGFEKS